MRNFKKTMSVLLAAIMAFSAFSALPFTASAALIDENNSVGAEFGDYEYKVLDDGTAEITDYTGNANELVVPDEIDGYKVTSIAYAFSDCESLTSVIIPDGVTSIECAFSDCENLTSVIIPDGVTSIGNYAFGYCTSLTDIKIPDSVTSIGNGAFEYCASLTDIVIPDSVNTISSWAFCGCESLTDIVIPDSVTSIGDSAFYGCSSLSNITIPDSLTEVGPGAFRETFWYVNQPYGVVYTGKIAYSYKGNMPENTSIELIEGTKSITALAFSDCSNLKSITIPDSVTSIGKYAFSNCSSLESIVIPEGIARIEEGTYINCTKLSDITIPDSVTSIGSDVFIGTKWLENQPDGVLYVGKVAYRYKGNAQQESSIIIKDGTLAIADYAFKGTFSMDSSIKNVSIPDSVTSIGESAFSGCESLTDIVIPDSVTTIGVCAFFGCKSLTNISIPESVTSIRSSTFRETLNKSAFRAIYK